MDPRAMKINPLSTMHLTWPFENFRLTALPETEKVPELWNCGALRARV